MRIFRRTGPVIGQPISREEERALRDELFVARWKPHFEAVEARTSGLAVILAGSLFLWMIIGVIVALIKHAGAVS